MANTSKITGFRPVKGAVGGANMQGVNIYSVAAADGTALFVGDPVKLDGSADADGLATVTKATQGAPTRGYRWYSTRQGEPNYW